MTITQPATLPRGSPRTAKRRQQEATRREGGQDTMRFANWAGLALAACCGFLAGVVLTRAPTASAADSSIRVSRLELTDRFGRVRAILATDRAGEPALRFMAKDGAEIASMGLSLSDLPEVRL